MERDEDVGVAEDVEVVRGEHGETPVIGFKLLGSDEGVGIENEDLDAPSDGAILAVAASACSSTFRASNWFWSFGE